MVDIENYTEDTAVVTSAPEYMPFAAGYGTGVRYGTTGDLMRFFAEPSFIDQAGAALTGDREAYAANIREKALFRELTAKRAINRVFDIAQPYDGDRVDELLKTYSVPMGDMTDNLHNAAQFLADDQLETYAEFLGRRAKDMQQVGPGANLTAAIADPATLSTYLIGGAGILATSTRASAAVKAGQSVNRVQQFAAARPFMFGAAGEAALDAGIQAAAGTADTTGTREFDVTSLALAALIGGGFNKVLTDGMPKIDMNWRPSPEQKAMAEASDLVTSTTQNVQKRAAVQIVDGKIKGAPTPGRVAGGSVKIAGVDVRRLFSPLVRIYTSDIPAIRQAAEMLGGVQTMLGRKVQDVGDIELDQIRMANIESAQMTPVLSDVNNAFRTVGVNDSWMAEYAMTQYVRRRTRGIAPGDIDMDELLGDLVAAKDYARIGNALENLYKQHGAQMKKLADNMTESKVRGARYVDNAEEGKYLQRAYSMINFPRIWKILGPTNIGRMFGGAIADDQLTDIMKVLAERIASGKKATSFYSVKKSQAAANKARGKKGTVVEQGTTTSGLTADEILATFPKEMAAEARKFSMKLGEGMSKRIYERMTNSFMTQMDAAQINDLTDEAIERMLADLKSGGKLDEETDEFMQALKDFVYRKPTTKKESDMGPLNRRIRLNELHKMRWSDMVSEKTKKPLSADELAQMKEDYAKAMGRSRRSKADQGASFEDFLNNGYQQLMDGYYHQYASQMALAKRGINKEGGATVDDLIALATKEVEDLKGRGVSQKRQNRAEQDLNAFIYLMHTANGRGIEFAKSKMRNTDNALEASLAQHTVGGKAVGIFRNISTSVHLGMVAFAQASEAGQLIGTVGARIHDIDRTTRVLREIGKVKDGSAPSTLTRDMMRIGLMNEGAMRKFEGMDYGGRFMYQEGDDLITRTYNATSNWRDFMGWINGIKPITMMMRVVAIGRAHDRLYAGATGTKGVGNAFSPAELKTYLTLNEEDVEKVYEAIRKFAIVNKKTGGVETLRPDLWHTLGPDYAALAAQLDEGLFRFSHTIVQQSGRGYAPIFMQGGLGSTLFQFMSYASNSFEKQFIPTRLLAERGDTGAAATRVSGAVLGSLLGYSTRLYVRSLGMSEEKRSKYLEENLTLDKTITGTIAYLPQLSGPMIAGSIAYDILRGSVTGDSTAIRRGFPTIPSISSAQDILSTGSSIGRLFNPDKDITEAQLHKLANYGTLGLANTPLVTVPRNVLAGMLGENRNSSLNPAPPRSEREETQQDQ